MMVLIFQKRKSLLNAVKFLCKLLCKKKILFLRHIKIARLLKQCTASQHYSGKGLFCSNFFIIICTTRFICKYAVTRGNFNQHSVRAHEEGTNFEMNCIANLSVVVTFRPSASLTHKLIMHVSFSWSFFFVLFLEKTSEQG